MIRHPYRGKPQLFGAPRYSEDALDIDWLAIMRHAYTEFHDVSPSLCAVAAKLRPPFLAKSPPPYLKILAVTEQHGQCRLRQREPFEGRVIQHGDARDIVWHSSAFARAKPRTWSALF